MGLRMGRAVRDQSQADPGSRVGVWPDRPYSQRAGYGGIGEAMGGLRYIVGEPDRPPSRVGISIGDSLAAVHACMGTLAALHHRDRTGVGQVVDAAIYESVLSMMESLVTEYDQLGHVRERSGPILPRIAPSNVYPTRDGIVMIGANQDTVFARLAAAMESPALAEDARYRDHTARGENQQELDALITNWTATFTTRDLLALLEKFGIPSGLIYRTADMLEDPHFAARQAIVTTEHPAFGRLRMQNVAPRLSASPSSVRTPAPDLGQHNDEIYGKLLGLDPATRRRPAHARRDLATLSAQTFSSAQTKRPGRCPAFSILADRSQVLSNQSLAMRAMVGSTFTVWNALLRVVLVVGLEVGDAQQDAGLIRLRELALGNTSLDRLHGLGIVAKAEVSGTDVHEIVTRRQKTWRQLPWREGRPFPWQRWSWPGSADDCSCRCHAGR